MYNKKDMRRYKVIMVILLTLIFLVSTLNCLSLAMTPKLISRMGFAFENLRKWAIRLATPAAAVSLAVGFFMKKFSFGDEERIRMSKKVIRGSFVSYTLLLSVDMILNAIQYLVS